ncbi:MAG: cation diffusion facilitator family transporter [Promethearchaeota archaeon]
MTIFELKSKYTHKKGSFSHRGEEFQLMKKYYPAKSEPHGNFLYAFLCLIYDGIGEIAKIKEKMRTLFISATKQVIIGEEDVDEFFQIAKRNKLISLGPNDTIELTKEGKRLVEVSYYHNLFTSHYLRIFFSEKFVMATTAIFLIILSLLKIFTGLNIDSEGMLSDGFENLTDLIKIAIIGILSIKFKRDKLASVLIILMMMFTGGSLIWSGIISLIKGGVIYPSTQAYIIGFVSIALNTALMFLKSMVGRISGNLSLLSDSKDSQLNILISTSVLIGLTFAIFELYFIDALIGIIIAVIIFREGFKIILELSKKEEDFDITTIKVFADNIYDNRLTAYILGSIRRESITRPKILKNFEEGLNTGRQYYEGFADFFYDKLDSSVLEKHLDKLNEGKFVQTINNELFLTSKGLKAFYKAKAREFSERAQNIRVSFKFNFGSLIVIIVFILFILLIIFGPQINIWISTL